MIGKIIELLINGLALGALYAIASAGFSLIFGVMRVLNIAHGIFLVLSAYLTYFIYRCLDMGFIEGVIIAILSVTALGLLTEKLVLYPLRAFKESLLILTLCIGMIIEQVIYLTIGPVYIMNPVLISGTIDMYNIKISTNRIILLFLSIFITLCLWAFLKYTKMGKAIRAIVQDEEVAAMYGVPVKRVRMITMGLSCALVSVAGILLNSIYMFDPSIGWEFMGVAIAVAIFGGLGNVFGTVAAGLILGIIESFVGYFISTNLRLVSYFISIFLILLIRPRGIFGGGKT
ncbi:MAG: branched-chain amino acid ABC transporter permease [Candidatus Bathyarchaeia archaeon]